MSSPPGNNLQNTGTPHLDEMTILLYLERQLDRPRAAEVSAHTQACGSCRLLLRALDRESRLLTRAMLEEEEPLPARLASFQETARRSLQWIWMVTFGLAATGVYALYTSYIEPVQNRLQDAGFGGTNLLGLLIFQGAFWKGWQSMISLVEVLALVTLGTFTVMVLRRRLRRGSMLAMMLAGLCGVMLLPAGASATEFRKGPNADVTSSEVIKGDIFLSGDRLSVDGTVEGDVYAFGRSLDVTGHVLGDVIVFAHDVHVTGQVDGNVRSFANSLTVSGTLGRSLTSFCEELKLEKTGKVNRSVTSFASRVLLDGRVGLDLLAFNDRMDLKGQVGGQIQMRGETFTIDSSAQVGGPIHYKGSKPPDVSSQAKLASPVDYQHVEKHHEYRDSGYYIWAVILAAAFVVFGLVLFSLMPDFGRDTVRAAESYGASLGLGVLVIFAVPIASIICAVTVVGLFVGCSTFALWLIALYAAQIVVGGLVGQWILGRTTEKWPLIGRMAIGVVVIRIVTLLPYGGWIKFAVVLWGLGAISLALYKRLQRTPSIPIPPPMAA